MKNIFGLASYFIKNGTRCETIKFGLTLLATIDTSNDKEICDILKILAHCEEFTDYVIKNTYNWNEKQQQEFYFYIAKKLHGWGKISIVELLEADTEEKKEWILCHGCKNSIMYSYLGYICAQKCDLFKRLKNGNLNEEEFYGATYIMDGLIDEGPCEGMSLIEEAVDLTLYYLKHLEKYINDNIEYIDILGRINLYFQNSEFENKELIKKQIDTITQKLDLNKIIEENINQKPYESISIAKNYDIDISDKVLSIIKNDFNKHYVHCYYLFNKNKFIDELLDICDKEIDERRYPHKMGNSFGLGKKRDGMIDLDFIIQHLDRYPQKGIKLIKIAINSPITRWRNMAVRCLKEWIYNLNKPLKEVDVELHDMVVDVEKIEVNSETKERWREILNIT